MAVSVDTVVISLVVGPLVSLVSAVVPARRASRVAPVAAMRDGAVEVPTRARRRLVAGVVLTAGGAVSLLAGLFGDPANPVGPVALGAVVVFLGVAVLGPVVAPR